VPCVAQRDAGRFRLYGVKQCIRRTKTINNTTKRMEVPLIVLLSIVIAIGVVAFIFQDSLPEDSWKWGAGFAVVALIGIGFLYQREGGKLFGPGGIFGPPAPAAPAILDGISSERYEPGLFSSSLTFKNQTRHILTDVEFVLTLFRENGEQVPVKKFWSKWGLNELQKFDVPAGPYQKMVLKGTAKSDGTEFELDSTWTFGKK
jgi:hypothetical protein